MAALLSNIYEAVFNSFDAYTFALALINIAFDLLLVMATIDSVYIMCWGTIIFKYKAKYI